MRKYLILLFAISFLSCQNKTKDMSENGNQNKEQPESVEVKMNYNVEELANNFKFTEGPAVDAEGNVYFTDIPEAKIWIWTVNGEMELFREESGGANGLFFDENQNLFICEGWEGRITRISPDANYEVVASKYQGKRFNQPNDIWPDAKGGAYFTDPEYNENPALHQGGMHVYYVNSENETIQVITDLVKPNGLIGTPNGKTLYVTDHGDDKTFSYTIQENGSLSNKTLFTNLGGDGMTIDQNGSIYLTTTDKKAIDVFNKNGDLFYSIALPQQPSNVCFGGKNLDELFITARTSIYKIKLDAKGVN
ncbi:SMP-30/gluconolactonase/LRE family protein [Psychroflexus salis]|nr:SMP-30/gluconolactonase/LRE family protein [Psychroflexus salis]